MSELLEQAITKVKQLSKTEQDQIARMILQKLETPDKLTSLWDKIDQLGEDPEQPSTDEITAMVKEVRHRLS